MPYLQTIIDYFEDQGLVIEEGESAEEVYERLEDNWFPNNRFPIWKILGNDLPDFLIWIQDQIDDDQQDDTETITFEPTRAQEDETREEEILETEIELLTARKELLELKIAELEVPRMGIIEGVKRFIRNIFGG